MTAHVHDSSTQPSNRKDSGVHAARATGSTRPRWLLPAVVGAIGVIVLVWYGILSPSAVLSGGLIGGMLLMHVGGHGGHAGKGDHGDGAQTGPQAVRGASDDPGRDRTDSAAVPGRSTTNDSNRSETHDDGQGGSHGCH